MNLLYNEKRQLRRYNNFQKSFGDSLPKKISLFDFTIEVEPYLLSLGYYYSLDELQLPLHYNTLKEKKPFKTRNKSSYIPRNEFKFNNKLSNKKIQEWYKKPKNITFSKYDLLN